MFCSGSLHLSCSLTFIEFLFMKISRLIPVLVLVFLTLHLFPANAQPPDNNDGGSILHRLQKLNTLGSVLYVAAHPDDENTRLLGYLANERKYRTVYISLTRGDGGQNLIGKEQGEELGMIRTRELLEARKVDGAEQAFARCNDFGYSKGPEETFSIWNKEEALADMVWAIRKFRPDVIINRFPTTGEGGHGHHTASAILAVEAFRAAADPNRFPEQLKHVTIWQARRIFHNSFNPRNQPAVNFEGQIQLDVGGYNPLLGRSYGEIAAESRSMHKSQGFGVARSRGTQIEYFKRLDGDTSVTEIFQNINTTWSRIQGGDKVSQQIKSAINGFNIIQPEKSLPQLFKILALIKKTEDAYWREVKEKEVLDLIRSCAGLWLEANSKNFYAVRGEPVDLTLSVISRLAEGIELKGIRVHEADSATSVALEKNKLTTIRSAMLIPETAPLSTPYWLEQPHRDGMFTVSNVTMTDLPWNDAPVKVIFTLGFEGQTINYEVPVNYKWTDPVRGEVYRPFEILPAVSLTPSDEVMLFTDSKPKTLTLRLKNLGEYNAGTLLAKAPPGWTISPSQLRMSLSGKGKEETITFTVTPPSPSDISKGADGEISFSFDQNGKPEVYEVSRIEYEHIPYLVLLKESKVKLAAFDLSGKVSKIGYIEGAGDDVAKCLKQAGFQVEMLDENKILKESLAQYGAIITGIRAYNTIENMESYYPYLMKYIEEGGNLIVQYNTFNFISSLKSDIGPYPFKITRNRVTDEKSAVSFLAPDHEVLNSPNKITQNDFKDWVQERGLYFAGDAAPEYQKVLSWNDPGEDPLDGGLIIAKKGKGHFVYTGISFFRQLPAGVEGAYRLMVNMINLGKLE